jgi:hypothetical protein
VIKIQQVIFIPESHDKADCNWNIFPCLEDVIETAWVIEALLVSSLCTYSGTE